MKKLAEWYVATTILVSLLFHLDKVMLFRISPFSLWQADVREDLVTSPDAKSCLRQRKLQRLITKTELIVCRIIWLCERVQKYNKP